jgi:hypothetical protein
MSNPAQAADTQSKQTEDTKSEVTFADRVKETLAKTPVDDKGNLVFSDDEEISEELKYAVTAEKRVRDNQANYTKSNQRIKALEAEKSALRNQAIGNVELNLTDEQAAELEDLKFEDPEAWRKKINVLENEAKAKRSQELDEEIKKVSESTLDETEKESRGQQLAEFLEANPGFELDDDIIANDIPPRITNKLEKGDISFTEFLQQCHDYLKTGKVVKQEDLPNTVNLSKVGGSSRPDGNAVKEDIVTSYKKETY